MRVLIGDDLEVLWPYDFLYPEQFQYMQKLYSALQSGHCLLEMPTGTGKSTPHHHHPPTHTLYTPTLPPHLSHHPSTATASPCAVVVLGR